MLKPLPNKDFLELIEKHSKILETGNKEKRKIRNKVKSVDKTSKKSNDYVTVNDLSKDFLQILNLKSKA